MFSFLVQLTHDPAPKEDVELRLEVGGAFLDSLLPAMRDEARSFGVRVPRGVSRVDALIPINMTRVYAKNVADGKLGGALVVAFGVRNEGYSMGRVSEMSWDLNVAADKAPNASAFHLPQEPTPEDVERHPFGLQTKLKQLTDQITAAQRGFYVMGFRRFGKTSLVRAALARVRATGEVLVCDILNGRELRPKQVWEHALRFLCDALDCSHQLVFDDAMPPVPQPQCFDNVRRRAKEKGFRAVYIVIDEAQQFFAEHLGIADAIKARNEGWWGLGTSEMAPLFFGFVGTTSLARFAGSNLLRTLLPYKASAPTGPELRNFCWLKKVAQFGARANALGASDSKPVAVRDALSYYC
ncbi:MAG: ATP-binding protein [Myxococcales bacterium]|nr:ATP-binding protein [Myxococcales bacterium]